MNSNTGIYIIVLALVFFSCKKDIQVAKPQPQTITKINELEGCNYSDTCPVNFKECLSPIGYLYTNKSPWIEDPVFNPNNNDEIIFFKWETQNNLQYNYSLVKLQISTGITTTISTKVNMVVTEAYWSTDGNIYYNGDDQKIHKYTRENTDDVLPNFPFNDICPRIIGDDIYSLNGTVKWPYIYYKTDKNGNRIDSMYGPGDYASDLSSDKKFAFADTAYTGYDISVITYSNNVWHKQKVASFYDIPLNLFVMDINWHPNNEDLYYLKPGELFKVNIKSKKVSLVKLACNAGRMMNNFTISPDGKKIVIAYQIPKQLNPQNPCNITFFSYLGIMDIDGCNERVLYKPDYAP